MVPKQHTLAAICLLFVSSLSLAQAIQPLPDNPAASILQEIEHSCVLEGLSVSSLQGIEEEKQRIQSLSLQLQDSIGIPETIAQLKDLHAKMSLRLNVYSPADFFVQVSILEKAIENLEHRTEKNTDQTTDQI